MENYYDILGVTEAATEDEIKKAYRKKSKEYHPDVNPKGEDMFKKVAEAYETLSDNQKKQQYDFQRKNPNAGMGGFGFGGGNVDPWEIFERMTGSGFSRRRQQSPERIVNLNVSITDVFLGLNKEINYTRKIKCDGCEGSGGDRRMCSTCNGRGSIQQRMGNGMFTQIINTPCHSCSGQGSTLISPCKLCSGQGNKNSNETVQFKIPIGIDNGQMIKIQNYGDFNNGMYGDLIVRMDLIPDSNFEKDGNNLVYTATFGLDDLKLGTIEVPHPDGNLSINLPQEFDTNVPLRVRGKGFRVNPLGDLYVKLRVKFKR